MNELSIQSEGVDKCGSAIGRVLLNGVPTDGRVPGTLLEAAVRWDVCYVLFLTYDVPFEEVLVICLLSKQFKLIDKAFLGGSYTTGNFRSLKIVQGNRLQFEFIGEAFWEIELLDRKQLRIPFIYDEAGVSRDIGFSRRFIVRKLLKNQGQG